jgi:hypothetical protein
MLGRVQTKVLSKRPVMISQHSGFLCLVKAAKSFILMAVRPLLWHGKVWFGSDSIIAKYLHAVFGTRS